MPHTTKHEFRGTRARPPPPPTKTAHHHNPQATMNTSTTNQQNGVPENESIALMTDNRRTMMTREQKVASGTESQGKYYTEREVQARIQAALQQQAEQHEQTFARLSAANVELNRQVDSALHTELMLREEIASLQDTSDHRMELFLRYKERAKLLHQGNTHHINTLLDDNEALRNMVAQLESRLVISQACSSVTDNNEMSKLRDDIEALSNAFAQMEIEQAASQTTQTCLSVADNNEESKHEPEASPTRTKRRVSFEPSKDTIQQYNESDPPTALMHESNHDEQAYSETITCVDESYPYTIEYNHQLKKETTYGCTLWHVGAAAAVAWAVVRAFK
jgi:hypothetical protein